MWANRRSDVLGGGILVAVGCAAAWYADAHYELGSIARMGPGLFPFAVGCLLAAFGVLNMVFAVTQEAATPQLGLRAALAVLAGIAAFAVAIGPLGMIPAIVALVVVSSLAGSPFRVGQLAMLIALLIVLAVTVFKVGLGMSIQIIGWPF